jgi:hypothetical protein
MSATDRTPARLVLQRPEGEELVYALEQGRTVTLGRDPSNTIVLPSQFVSKRHVLISWTPRGVRIEDQDSANGLTVNGLTVHAAQLSSGDVIEIGDQRLVFEMDRPGGAPAVVAGPSAVASGNKGLRLMLAALFTMLIMVGGLFAVYVFFLAPAEEDVAAADGTRRVRTVAFPSDTPITPFDSPEAQAVEKRALAAGDRPVDWLFDEGQLAYRNGRLLAAYRLLHGALLRDNGHEPSRRLLLEVMGERDLRLRSLEAAAIRADEELKFAEAAQQWEQVQALTLENEPLNARARSEAARLRERARQ